MDIISIFHILGQKLDSKIGWFVLHVVVVGKVMIRL